MNLFEKIINRIVKLIMVLLCGYLIIASMYSTVRLTDTEHIYFTGDRPWVHVVAALVIMALIVAVKLIAGRKENADNAGKISVAANSEKKNRISKIPNTSVIFYIVLALYFILLCYLAFSANLVPKFDPHKVSRTAVQIINGDYSAFLKEGYARRCDNQKGFILFLVGIYKLFGCNNYLAVEVINAVCYALTVLFIRNLAVRFLTKRKYLADIIGIALCLFTPVYGFVTFIYGTAPYLALSLGAMLLEYDFFNKEKHKAVRIILSGILIALATVLKTNALIYLLAMLCYGIIKALGLVKKGESFVNKNRNESLFEDDEQVRDETEAVFSDNEMPKGADFAGIVNEVTQPDGITSVDKPFLTERGARFASYILGLAWIILLYVLAGKCVDSYMHKLTGMDDLSGAPRTAHIAMGMQESSNKSSGWYNDYVESVFKNNGYDHDAADAAAIVNIKMSLGKFKADPTYAVGFFLKKIVSQWCEPTYDSLASLMSRVTINDSIPSWLGLATEDGFGNETLIGFMNIMQTLIYFGCFIYFVLTFGRKNKKATDEIFPAIVVIGGFLFHLMWEANSQYILVYVVLMIGYAVTGFEMASEKVSEVILKRSEHSNGNADALRISDVICDNAAFIILLLAVIVTAFAPDDSVIGRALKMTWNDEEYREVRAYNKTAEAEKTWAIRFSESTEDYLDKRYSGFLSGILPKGDIPNGRYILRPACDPDETLMIEDDSLEAGARAVLGSDGEDRVILWYEDGGYTIRFQHSQLVVDVDMASEEQGAKVQQWVFNGDVSQIFTLEDAGDGYYAIMYRDTMALTVDEDGALVVDDYDGRNEQKWYLEKCK